MGRMTRLAWRVAQANVPNLQTRRKDHLLKIMFEFLSRCRALQPSREDHILNILVEIKSKCEMLQASQESHIVNIHNKIKTQQSKQSRSLNSAWNDIQMSKSCRPKTRRAPKYPIDSKNLGRETQLEIYPSAMINILIWVQSIGGKHITLLFSSMWSANTTGWPSALKVEFERSCFVCLPTPLVDKCIPAVLPYLPPAQTGRGLPSFSRGVLAKEITRYDGLVGKLLVEEECKWEVLQTSWGGACR